jgi:hypothetical protein
VKVERRRGEGRGRKYAEEGLGESSAERSESPRKEESRAQNIEKVSWVYLPYSYCIMNKIVDSRRAVLASLAADHRAPGVRRVCISTITAATAGPLMLRTYGPGEIVEYVYIVYRRRPG